ncbi:MAG: hypothetical protein HGA65_00030 [Oscillochloris sp.]|nr:hypothetical protein [Oscillochloris sp.]
MNLETALTALRTAGYGITAEGPDHWRVRFGQGPQALDNVVNSAEIIAFVERQVVPSDAEATPRLDLPQTIAMLRAAGLSVEPVGPGYWQVIFADGSRALANLFTNERLLRLGNTVAATVPWLIRGRLPQVAPQRADRPVDPALVCYTLFRLGWVTASDLAEINSYDEQRLGAALMTLAGAGHIIAGPEETWRLTASGWQHIAHLIPTDVHLPGEEDLPDPRLAIVVARLIRDLRPLQLTRLELTYPGIADALPNSRGRSALLTAAPEPRGIAWTRNLMAQATAAEVPTLSFAVELIEADRATSEALSELLQVMRQRLVSQPIVPCLVVADDGLAAVVRAEASQVLPKGPWAVSTVHGAQEHQWMTYPSGRMEIDLTLALSQARN